MWIRPQDAPDSTTWKRLLKYTTDGNFVSFSMYWLWARLVLITSSLSSQRVPALLRLKFINHLEWVGMIGSSLQAIMAALLSLHTCIEHEVHQTSYSVQLVYHSPLLAFLRYPTAFPHQMGAVHKHVGLLSPKWFVCVCAERTGCSSRAIL